MEKSHFEQAKLWMEGAKYISDFSESREKYAVAISMCIHSILKANDSLTMKFTGLTARRLFEDLVKKNFIKAQYADYKQIIQDAINSKAKAEYRGGFFSKSDFESMKRDTEKFLKMAGEIFK